MKEIRLSENGEYQNKHEHKIASPANDQNADTTLLHSHDKHIKIKLQNDF